MSISEDSSRKRAHIRRGGRVFLPQERMRRIRWEESMAHSHIKRSPVIRKGKVVPHHVVHYSCTCGSIDCIASACAFPLHTASSNQTLWGE